MIAKFSTILCIVMYASYGCRADTPAPILAAVKSTHSVQVKEIAKPPLTEVVEPKVVEVAPLDLPIQIVFNSRSSPFNIHYENIFDNFPYRSEQKFDTYNDDEKATDDQKSHSPDTNLVIESGGESGLFSIVEEEANPSETIDDSKVQSHVESDNPSNSSRLETNA